MNMKVVTKVLLFAVLAVGLVFARSGKNNPIAGKKIVKSEHSWIKDHSANNGNDQLDRKRSHKRRRKIRKPIKGLR